MPVLIINNAEPADRAFNEPLFDTVSAIDTIAIAEYRAVPPLTQIENNYDAAIVSGVPLHYDAGTLTSRLEYLERLLELRIPLLGVCLGHQNIAALFGADIKYGIESENGAITVQTLTPDRIFDRIPQRFEVAALHSCSVSLPADFKLLASSETCSNQIMKHDYKNIYGFQFHPELSTTGRTLLCNFLRLSK